ncbi:MAG: hypothetical protein A2V70_08655 [Planctomycetes bacterium RBG_13_63_9]|nr:MAG: hypothetical protein A2V70_08655 [Planctomycetes bacterium RBG_13_63_9]
MVRLYRAALCLVFSLVLVAVPLPATAEQKAKLPEHRVMAIYFHRTQRCPTCKRISAYIEEGVKDGFAQQIKDKKVSLHLIDYQNKKNEQYAKFYKIAGPTLVIVDVHDNKVTRWAPMPKVWSLVGQKKDFLEYVQEGVRDYLEKKAVASASSDTRK